MFELVSMMHRPSPLDQYDHEYEEYVQVVVRLHQPSIPGKAKLKIDKLINWLRKNKSDISQSKLNFKI